MDRHVDVRGGCILALAVLATFGQATVAAGQGEASIEGRVVAVADSSAIGAARVVLTDRAGHTAGSLTDQYGRFAFRAVLPGAYVLSAEAAGFTRKVVNLAVDPRELKTVKLSLDLGSFETSVQVTADAAATPSTHSPSSTLLTAERLQDLPASHHTSLPDAIVTAAPGMVRGHDDFVHIRGHEVALNPMINGVAFWENPHALLSAGISPGFIETVNVMTGGFPAEYGNRFGGVLDIVTKSGLRMDNDGSITLSGGEAGRRQLAGEFGGHRNRFGYYVYGAIFQSSRFVSPPDPKAIHDEGRGGHLFLQLDRDLSTAGALRAVVMGDGASFEIPKHPRDLELRPLASAEQRSRQQSAILGWTLAASQTSVGASFYQRWSSARLFPASGPLTASADLKRTLLTIGAKADVVRFSGRHAMKAGVDFVRLHPEERLSYDYAGYRDLTHLLDWPHIHVSESLIAFSGSSTGGQGSAYVQDRIDLGERVSADVGLRVDRYDLLVRATHVSPRVNLAVRLGSSALVHASYNHFFVPPPIEGVLSSNAGLTARIREIGRPLPAIDPTTEHQFELGASGPAGPIRLGVTGYYRATDNPVHTTVWPDSRIYSYASFDRARAYGLEAKVEVPLLARSVSSYLNYALGRVNFYNPVTGGFVTEAAHLTETSRFLAPMDQTHTLTGGATYRHTSGLWFAALLEYGSGTPMGHGGDAHDHQPGDADHDHGAASLAVSRIPSHVTANISIGADLFRGANRRGRLSFQLDLENFTDDVYLIAQEGEFSPAQYSPPRLISATVKLRF